MTAEVIIVENVCGYCGSEIPTWQRFCTVDHMRLSDREDAERTVRIARSRRVTLCGIPSGASRHRALGEPVDEECRKAENAARQEFRAREHGELSTPERVRRATEEAATWWDQAACRGLDWHRMTLLDQIATCVDCPVIDRCRAYADQLEQRIAQHTVQTFPVYGGESGADRVLRRTGGQKGKPGRPGRTPRAAG